MTILQHIKYNLEKHPSTFLSDKPENTTLRVLRTIFHHVPISNNKTGLTYCINRMYFEDGNTPIDPSYSDYQAEEVESKDILKFFTGEKVYQLLSGINNHERTLLESELDTIKDLDYLDLRIPENVIKRDEGEYYNDFILQPINSRDDSPYIVDNINSGIFQYMLYTDQAKLNIPLDYLEAMKFYLEWAKIQYKSKEALEKSNMNPNTNYRRYLSLSYFSASTDKKKEECIEEAKKVAAKAFNDFIVTNQSNIEKLIQIIDNCISTYKIN